MKLLNTYAYEIKKSKFIGYYYEVDSVEEVKEILEILNKEHKKARHLPYAYVIANQMKKSDDKEPANTAGTPIFNILTSNNLDHRLIVIIRYFGGIKLGTGGLFRSYGLVAKEIIKNDN